MTPSERSEEVDVIAHVRMKDQVEGSLLLHISHSSRRLLVFIFLGAALCILVGSVLSGLLQVALSQGPAEQPHKMRPFLVHDDPHYSYNGQAQQFPCLVPNTQKRCYNPQQIRTAYGIQPLIDQGITGKGRSIAIIDAYDAPHIKEDLQRFNQAFGLPEAPLNIYYPGGKVPFNAQDQEQVGWSGETSLDVQWAHAIAPDATINLVLAKSSNDNDFISALNYIISQNLGDVISMSFGENEACVGRQMLGSWHQALQRAAQQNITVLASAGDTGAALESCGSGASGTGNATLAVSFPAVDPLVTSVGGTQLIADATGKYIGESVWNEAAYQMATGGGYSTQFMEPAYQRGVTAIDQRGQRGEPDVSYNAAVNGGVLTAWSDGPKGNGFYTNGGTSAGSPQWAGIVALGAQMKQGRLGPLNQALYALGQNGSYTKNFHDVTNGNNSITLQQSQGQPTSITGYAAGSGWDATTGWGTPDAANLLPALINQTQQTGTASMLPPQQPRRY